MSKIISALALGGMLMLGASLRSQAADENPFVYIAGYDNTVYCFEFNSSTGELKELSKSDCGKNPTYLAIHPTRKYLYAANENKGGMVSAYSIDPKDGKLTKLNEVSSGGDGPCHVVVHPDGKWVFSANYGSGHVGIASIKADGSLDKALDPVFGGKDSHAHQVVIDASGKYIFVPFLGNNSIAMYKFDEVTGAFMPNDPPLAVATKSFAGPRHMALHPNGKFAYSINESNCTIDSWQYDRAKGVLSKPEALPTMPEGTEMKGKSTAHIVVSPDGKFVYGSNRGYDTIAIYSVDPASGRLTFVGHENGGGEVKIPRDFALDFTGKFAIVANQKTGNITVYQRLLATGTMTKIGSYPVAKGPAYVGFMMKP